VTLVAISKSASIRGSYDNYPSPKWWNACRWPDFDRPFIDSSLLTKQELINKVEKSAKVAKNHAEDVKIFFVSRLIAYFSSNSILIEKISKK